MSASRQHGGEPLRASSGKRFTTTEKVDAVLRLLKGEPLAKLSLDLGVATQRLERWLDDFVNGGSSALSKRKSAGLNEGLSKRAATIFQWVAFLIVLAVVIGVFEMFLQRAGGE